MFDIIGRTPSLKQLDERHRVVACTVTLYVAACVALLTIGQLSAPLGGGSRGGAGFGSLGAGGNDEVVFLASFSPNVMVERPSERSPDKKRTHLVMPKKRDIPQKLKIKPVLPSSSTLLLERLVSRDVLMAAVNSPFPDSAPSAGSELGTSSSGRSGSGDARDGDGNGVGEGHGDSGSGASRRSSFKHVPYGDVMRVVTVQPEYPREAIERNIEGIVTVLVSCSASGDVVDVRFLSGDDVFKETVLKAAWGMKYRSEPEPFTFTQPFEFRLTW